MLEDGQYTTPNDVASYILNIVDRDAGEAVTHLKLQKLVYYAQSWYLANFDRALFEEDMQAWTHGPVARSVYDQHKGNSWAALEATGESGLPESVRGFVTAVYEEYGQYGAKKLEKMTHDDLPWLETRGDLRPEQRCEDPISKVTMRNFYAAQLGKEPVEAL